MTIIWMVFQMHFVLAFKISPFGWNLSVGNICDSCKSRMIIPILFVTFVFFAHLHSRMERTSCFILVRQIRAILANSYLSRYQSLSFGSHTFVFRSNSKRTKTMFIYARIVLNSIRLRNRYYYITNYLLLFNSWLLFGFDDQSQFRRLISYRTNNKCSIGNNTWLKIVKQ